MLRLKACLKLTLTVPKYQVFNARYAYSFGPQESIRKWFFAKIRNHLSQIKPIFVAIQLYLYRDHREQAQLHQHRHPQNRSSLLADLVSML